MRYLFQSLLHRFPSSPSCRVFSSKRLIRAIKMASDADANVTGGAATPVEGALIPNSKSAGVFPWIVM